MKWFKHYSNSSDGETLQKIFRKYGLEGEARYWRLIELLAKRFEKNNTEFYLPLETIRQSLRHRSLTDCRLFLDHLTTFSGMIVEYSGNDCLIKYAKLLEIKDNHTKNLQVASKLVSENLPLEKEREKEKEYILKHAEENKKNLDASPMLLTPEQIHSLWDKIMVPRGFVKTQSMFPIPRAIREIIFIDKQMKHIGITWEDYFNKIDKLITKPEYRKGISSYLDSVRFMQVMENQRTEIIKQEPSSKVTPEDDKKVLEMWGMTDV